MSKFTDRWPEPHHVYRCYDADGDLLYIGCTVDPENRMRGHRTRSPWFGQVARIDYDTYPDSYTGLDAEGLAIATERPRWNKQIIKRYADAAARRAGDAA